VSFRDNLKEEMYFQNGIRGQLNDNTIYQTDRLVDGLCDGFSNLLNNVFSDSKPEPPKPAASSSVGLGSLLVGGAILAFMALTADKDDSSNSNGNK